jgi:hypothetical protein
MLKCPTTPFPEPVVICTVLRCNTGEECNTEKQPCVTCIDPLQEMVPAMTFTPFHITTKQLSNGLTEEKPAASTNVDCNRTVCVERPPHTGTAYVTAEQLGKKGFIFAVNGLTLAGMEKNFHTCYTQYKFISVKRDGVRYTICETSTYTGPTEATRPEQIPGGAHIPLCQGEGLKLHFC